jgi:hypothetical protein
MSVTWEQAINRVAIGGSCYPGATAAAQRWQAHVGVVDAIGEQVDELIRKVEAAGWGAAASAAFRARLRDVRDALREIADGDQAASGDGEPSGANGRGASDASGSDATRGNRWASGTSGNRTMSALLQQCAADCAAAINQMKLPSSILGSPQVLNGQPPNQPVTPDDLIEKRKELFAQEGRVRHYPDGYFARVNADGSGGDNETMSSATITAYEELAGEYRAVRVPPDVAPRLPFLPAAQALQGQRTWWEQLGSVADSVNKAMSALGAGQPAPSTPTPYTSTPYTSTPYTSTPYEPSPFEPYEPPPFEPYEPPPFEPASFEEGLAGVGGGLGDGSAGTLGPATPMTTAAPATAAAGRLAAAAAGGAAAAGAAGVGMYPPMMPFGARPGQQSDQRGKLVDDSGTFDPPEAPTGLLG